MLYLYLILSPYPKREVNIINILTRYLGVELTTGIQNDSANFSFYNSILQIIVSLTDEIKKFYENLFVDRFSHVKHDLFCFLRTDAQHAGL